MNKHHSVTNLQVSDLKNGVHGIVSHAKSICHRTRCLEQYGPLRRKFALRHLVVKLRYHRCDPVAVASRYFYSLSTHTSSNCLGSTKTTGRQQNYDTMGQSHLQSTTSLGGSMHKIRPFCLLTLRMQWNTASSQIKIRAKRSSFSIYTDSLM